MMRFNNMNHRFNWNQARSLSAHPNDVLACLPSTLILGWGLAPMSEKVLSFGDSCLRRGDVELLQGPAWLNDQVREARGSSTQRHWTALTKALWIW